MSASIPFLAIPRWAMIDIPDVRTRCDASLRLGYGAIDRSCAAGYHHSMSKTEILEELPKLTPEERAEIRLKLAELDGNEWLDSDDPLSDKEKALLEARLDDLEKHPENSVPWTEAEAQLKARYGE